MNTSTPTGVCIDCFADYALKNYVSKNLAVEWCNFCGRNSDCKIAADPSDVLAYFENCLSHDWEAPEDCLYYDSREGGWQTGGLAVVYDGYDLIQEVFSDCFENSKLLEYFSYELSDNNYVETSFARLSAGEVYQYSWESFTHTVKHRKRYLFSQINDTEAEASDEELIPTASFVNVISGYIVSNSLIIEVPVGTKFYRVRIYETPFELTGQKLGTSPVEKANYSNRMSPAGIAMFYGGLAEETALIETIDNDVNRAQNKKAAIGKFQTLRTLRIVDFTKLPRIPSLFDDELRELRDGLTILHAFIKDLSKPIKKDGREHIEYVPTQIITEFIRDFLKVNGQRIDGIYYPSSRNGKPACVLFIDNDNCVDSHDDTEGILLLEQPVETIDALSWHTSVYSQKK